MLSDTQEESFRAFFFFLFLFVVHGKKKAPVRDSTVLWIFLNIVKHFTYFLLWVNRLSDDKWQEIASVRSFVHQPALSAIVFTFYLRAVTLRPQCWTVAFKCYGSTYICNYKDLSSFIYMISNSWCGFLHLTLAALTESDWIYYPITQYTLNTASNLKTPV